MVGVNRALTTYVVMYWVETPLTRRVCVPSGGGVETNFL